MTTASAHFQSVQLPYALLLLCRAKNPSKRGAELAVLPELLSGTSPWNMLQYGPLLLEQLCCYGTLRHITARIRKYTGQIEECLQLSTT